MVSEPDYQSLLDHIRTTMTMASLLTGFTFTALIALLVGLEDVTSLLSQITLFFLLASFQVSMLYLGIMQGGEAFTAWHASKGKPSPPSLPIFRYVNLLGMLFIQLLGISVDLMFFLRALIYLGLISIVSGGAIFLVYLLYIYVPLLKLFKSSGNSNGTNQK